MRDVILITAGGLIIFAAIVLLRPRKTLAGEMDAPINIERERAKSEAAMAAPVSAADEQDAAPYVAYVEEIGTGEFPNLAFEVDPLGAPIPDGYQTPELVFFQDTTASWLSAFSWTAAAEPPVPLASVQVAEPEPFEVMGFTQTWITAADVQRMAAEAKAGADR